MTRSSFPTTRRLPSWRFPPALTAVLALLACAPAPVQESPGTAPGLPDRPVAGAAHYRVVEDGTRVYARVYRGGSMAKLGHNHVIMFPGVSGDIYLADELGDSVLDLAVPVARAVVDPPGLRRRQGTAFRSGISENARERTRRNMLGEGVLHARAHPYLLVSSSRVEGPRDRPRVTLHVTIRGATRSLTTPVTLRRKGDRLIAEGGFALRQSEFGIEPFSVMAGALKVKDRVELEFAVAAKRVVYSNSP